MYIKVKISPGSKKETIIETADKYFTISVKEPARQNLANKRIIEIIAEYYNVSTRDVRIISGHRSPSKILSIREP